MKETRSKLGTAKAKWTREKVRRYLLRRFYTRFHMSLILASSSLAAMLTNWVLLQGGVYVMWMRYPISVAVSYLVFLAGVRLWLTYVGVGRRAGLGEVLIETSDVPSVFLGESGSGGGSVNLPGQLAKSGGQFAGGGASGAWMDGNQTPLQVAGMQSNVSGVASSLSEPARGIGRFVDLDFDASVLVSLAILLFASIFLLSGYIIWFAPDILGEAAFGAVLCAGLARPAQRLERSGWVGGVVKKTWWPFALVLTLSLSFAGYAAVKFPDARTLGQAFSMAIS